MRRDRLLAVALAVAVAVQSTAAVAGVAAAQDADVAISGVSVTPEEPAPGEEFDVTVNVSNLASSNGSVTVTDVYVRSNGDLEEYTRVENPGSIPAGGSLSVPFTLSFDETGTKNLRVHATVRTPDGSYESLEYPLYVTVAEPDDVLVSVPASEATVGEETPVNVTVANGAPGTISGVRVELGGDGTVASPERVAGSIESGTDRSFQYNVTFQERGTRTLEATLTYTTSQGVTRTVTESSDVEVVNESTDDDDDDRIEGEISLVGVETSGTEIVTIQGEAANVGGTDVESVLLRVPETDSVTPVGSSGEYFVGAVNASAFDTFELIARTSGNASSIPVEIEYIVDDERRTDTRQVPIDTGGGAQPAVGGGPGVADEPDREHRHEPGEDRMRTPPRDRSTGLLGGIGSLAVPLALVAGLLGGGYVLWKRR